MINLPYYFIERGRLCSYAGKSKRKPKLCKRVGSHTFRGHKVCNFHGTKLMRWNIEGRI